MAPNAVEYAEQNLAVHDVWNDVQSNAEAAQTWHEDMARLSSEIRRQREKIADREAQLASDERGKNPEMSGTAFGEHMRIMLRLDPDLIQLRTELLDYQRDYDWAESQERGFRGKLDGGVARLHELGGLLAFYGAAKVAPALERATTPLVQVQHVQHVPSIGDTE